MAKRSIHVAKLELPVFEGLTPDEAFTRLHEGAFRVDGIMAPSGKWGTGSGSFSINAINTSFVVYRDGYPSGTRVENANRKFTDDDMISIVNEGDIRVPFEIDDLRATEANGFEVTGIVGIGYITFAFDPKKAAHVHTAPGGIDAAVGDLHGRFVEKLSKRVGSIRCDELESVDLALLSTEMSKELVDETGSLALSVAVLEIDQLIEPENRRTIRMDQEKVRKQVMARLRSGVRLQDGPEVLSYIQATGLPDIKVFVQELREILSYEKRLAFEAELSHTELTCEGHQDVIDRIAASDMLATDKDAIKPVIAQSETAISDREAAAQRARKENARKVLTNAINKEMSADTINQISAQLKGQKGLLGDSEIAKFEQALKKRAEELIFSAILEQSKSAQMSPSGIDILIENAKKSPWLGTERLGKLTSALGDVKRNLDDQARTDSRLEHARLVDDAQKQADTIEAFADSMGGILEQFQIAMKKIENTHGNLISMKRQA